MKKRQILLGAITALLLAAGLLLASCEPVFCNKDRKCSIEKDISCAKRDCAVNEAAGDLNNRNATCDCP